MCSAIYYSILSSARSRWRRGRGIQCAAEARDAPFHTVRDVFLRMSLHCTTLSAGVRALERVLRAG